MKILLRAVLLLFFVLSCQGSALSWDRDRFLVLCYHDIPKNVNLNDYSVDQASFIDQIEYLSTHGYNFLSLNDIIEANRGNKALPEKPVLLTFDDAYLSFYEFVYPVLKLYGYPCLLAVVTDWIDNPPPEIKEPLMSWDQLREVAKSDLVSIASHTHNLHRGVIYNPQGNESWAAVSRIYNPETEAYESEEAYRKRIYDDLSLSKRILKRRLGVDSQAVVWPYGQYNEICLEEAKGLGFKTTFSLLAGLAHLDKPYAINRCMIEKNPLTDEFIDSLKKGFVDIVQHRIIQADLDIIYDPDPVQQERNLDIFVERIFNMKPNTVFLQAFCDEDGDGNVSSVYFPNRVLPMRADLFNRVVNQLAIREISVYAWMPMLSIALPNEEKNDSLRVREFRDGEKRFSTSWYKRLSPFSQGACQKLVMLYEDMALNARIKGVVFQDDGYLNDYEDFHPDALDEYIEISGDANIPYQELSQEEKHSWTRAKTDKLIELSTKLKEAVLRYRPEAEFIRTLYAPVIAEPESEEWLAQNYEKSLKAYDYVMVMAYPKMEKIRRPKKWLKGLVREAKKYPEGLDKTIFKVQTYDWNRKCWIDSTIVNSWLKILAASGAKHIGYYPDNYIENRPDKKRVRVMISAADFPFKIR